MADRPLGMTVLALVVGLLGIGSLLSVFMGLRLIGAMPPGQPLVVAAFVYLLPVFFLVFGLLGGAVSVALWYGHPFGRVGGLAWIGLYVVEEVVTKLLDQFGPGIFQQVDTGGAGETVVKVLVAVAVFSYLWAAGDGYLKRQPEPSVEW